jgi:hypothetical protein
MGTPLSPYQECHPFLPSSLAYDLVVSSPVDDTIAFVEDEIFGAIK